MTRESSRPSSEVTDPEPIQVGAAARVLEVPVLDDHDQQAAYFGQHGLLVLRGVLSRRELADLDQDLNRLVQQHAIGPRIREGYDLEPKQDPSRAQPTFRKIGGISDLTDTFKRLLKQPRILEVLHAIMGPDIYLFRDVVMMKPARVGREKPWHQDSAYWPYRPMDLVSAVTALDDATPENGCLQVIPGTHQREFQHYGGELHIDVDDNLQAQTRYVPLEAGDTLLFHSLLLHASQSNLSDRDRRVCIFSYRPAGLEYIGKGEKPKDIPVSIR